MLRGVGIVEGDDEVLGRFDLTMFDRVSNKGYSASETVDAEDFGEAWPGWEGEFEPMWIRTMKEIAAVAVVLVLMGFLVVGCSTQHQVEVVAEPSGGGIVAGGGTYVQGRRVAVAAEAFENYAFVGWTSEGETVSENSIYEFEVTGDVRLVAVFEQRPEETREISLFFGSPDAMTTGEPGEFGFVAPVSRQIWDVSGGTMLLALHELIDGPTPEDGDVLPVMPDEVEIIGFEVGDGVAVFDLSSEMFGPDWSGGSLGGIVFTQAIVRTLTQFPEVDRVQIRVEGEYWEDGHFVWDRPIGISDIEDEGLGGASG